MDNTITAETIRWALLVIGTLNLILVIAAIVKAYELTKLHRKTNEAFTAILVSAGKLDNVLGDLVETLRTVNNTQNSVLELKKEVKEYNDTVVKSINLMGEELDRMASDVLENQRIIKSTVKGTAEAVSNLSQDSTNGK